MPQKQSSSSGFGRFVAELRRRHVVRVTLAYGAVVFVALQAAEIVLPAFLPGFEAEAGLRVMVVAFLLLFPVVVALAWVYEITPQGIRAMESIDAEAGRPPAGRLVPRMAFLAFTVVVAGMAGWWWYQSDAAQQEAAAARRAAIRSTPFVGASTDDASGPIRSLAVLPLEDFSAGDDGQAYFAAGMHEALISQLSQLGTVRVISRTSSEGYRREGRSLPQVGADLGVDAVVEGSVLRADGRVRITVQLIHAASDTHLWARDYERDLKDIIALQREVATAIAAEIDARLAARPTRVAEADPEGAAAEPVPADESTAAGAARPASEGAAPPAAPEAPTTVEVQDAVLRGRFALRDAPRTGTGEAERHFRTALSLDSTFGPALTGLAGAHLLRGIDTVGTAAFRELLDAHQLAVRAVERDPGSMEAREVLASTEEALADLGTRMADVGAGLAYEARFVRRGDDSVYVIAAGDTMRLAADGIPMVTATEMGRAVQVAMAADRGDLRSEDQEMRAVLRLEAGGRPEAALERVTAALQRHPDSPPLWDVAERLAVATGDLQGALDLRRDRAEALGTEASARLDALERRIRDDGPAGYWQWRLEELEARQAAGEDVSPVERAAANAALGRTDRALDLLEAARIRRDPRLASLRTDPVWDGLRSEPRFVALLEALSRRSGPRPTGGRR